MPSGAALRGFPEFPQAGTLLILEPPFTPDGDELTSCAAEVQRSTVKLLKYSYWQVNSAGQLGLLCRRFDFTPEPGNSDARHRFSIPVGPRDKIAMRVRRRGG